MFPPEISALSPCLRCGGAHLVKNQFTWFDPWVRKIPWRRDGMPTPVFLPGESHGPRSLAGCSPWGHRESDRTERVSTAHTSVRTSSPALFPPCPLTVCLVLCTLESLNRPQRCYSTNAIRLHQCLHNFQRQHSEGWYALSPHLPSPAQGSSGFGASSRCWLWTWHVHSLDDPTDLLVKHLFFKAGCSMLGVNRSWNIWGLHFISSVPNTSLVNISTWHPTLSTCQKGTSSYSIILQRLPLGSPNCLFLSRKFLGAQSIHSWSEFGKGLSWHFLFIVTGSSPSYISTTERVARPNGTQNYK